MNLVIEWDPESHTEGTNMWERAVKVDGGRKCRRFCELIGEPLIEGMVVGKSEDELTTVQREEVCQIYLSLAADTDCVRKVGSSKARIRESIPQTME